MKKSGISLLVSLVVFLLLAVFAVYGQDKGDEVYVIKKGDTLWDLSGEHLKDPYQWPELWERNQYITNPHLIYPGNSLRLHGRPKSVRPGTVRETEAAGGAVTEVQPVPETATTQDIKGVTEESAVTARTEEATVPIEKEEVPSTEEVEQALPTEEVEPALTTGEGEVVQVLRKGEVELVILEEDSLGTIVDARFEKELLAQGDIVYLALKKKPAEVGTRFTVFRTTKMLKNPYTRKKGKKIYVLGALKVTAVKGVLYQAEITDSMDAILRGDEVMTYRVLR